MRVRGGSHGLAAAYDEMVALADSVDAFADELREMAAVTGRVLLDGDLLASSLLAPGTFAASQVAVAAAATGSEGLLPAAIAWEADAVAIRETTQALLAADDTAAALFAALLAPLAGVLAGAYGAPGAPVVRAVPSRVAPSLRPPEDLTGLLENLQAVRDAEGTGAGPRHGTVAVQTSVASDGTTRHVVYLPGTDDMTSLPGTPGAEDAQVRDMGGNLALLAGYGTAHVAGVRRVLRQAGVRPGEPVLLVGHSQGGMAALHLAAHPGRLTISEVVNVGAPAGQVAVPGGTGVLSLQNTGDPVPHLDGTDNPRTPQHVTVTVDVPTAARGGGIVARHALSTYVAGAAMVQEADHPSVRDHLDRLVSHRFLGGSDTATVTGTTYQITQDQIPQDQITRPPAGP